MSVESSPSPSAEQGLSYRQMIFRLIGISTAYFFAHQLAFLFPDTEKVIMAIWPAGGIGLAALLLNPLRFWPAIILCLYAAGVSADVFFSESPLLGQHRLYDR